MNGCVKSIWRTQFFVLRRNYLSHAKTQRRAKIFAGAAKITPNGVGATLCRPVRRGRRNWKEYNVQSTEYRVQLPSGRCRGRSPCRPVAQFTCPSSQSVSSIAQSAYPTPKSVAAHCTICVHIQTKTYCNIIIIASPRADTEIGPYTIRMGTRVLRRVFRESSCNPREKKFVRERSLKS